MSKRAFAVAVVLVVALMRLGTAAPSPGGNIDLTGAGLVLQSQKDPRWADFRLGPPDWNERNHSRCGCYLATLSTVITYHMRGAGAGSLPKFPHLQRGPVNTFPQVFSFSPEYLNQLLTVGPDPSDQRSPGWGFYGPKDACGVLVYDNALAEIGNPVLDADGRPVTPTGVETTASKGFDYALIDRNLAENRPTIVVIGHPTIGFHAQVIAGWDDTAREYLVLDPVWATGSRPKRASEAWPTGNTAAERYTNWKAAITDTRDVRPVRAGSDWLFFEDDPEPIEILAISPTGRRTGFDAASGGFVREDPSVSYTTFSSWADPAGLLAEGDERRAIVIRNPLSGTYGFQVLGTGSGPFTLRVATASGDERTEAATLSGTISAGELRNYEVTYSPIAGASVREVERFAPRARAGNDMGGFVGTALSFDGRDSYQIGGAVSSYTWSFGDGSTGTGSQASRAYAVPGTYTATLTVANAQGESASDTLVVRIVAVPGPSGKQTLRASTTSSGGEVQGLSSFPDVSADGRYVAFASFSPELVPNDTNNIQDIFVKDLVTGAIERVSVASGGGQALGDPFGGGSRAASISADGRYVAFASTAHNLAPQDTGADSDIFLHDRQSGTTELVSVSGDGGDIAAVDPDVSADGRHVAFVVTPGLVFLRDRLTATTEAVSVSTAGQPSGGAKPDLSADGRYVAFESGSPDLVPGDTNGWIDVFVRDRQLGATERVSLKASGAQTAQPSDWPSLSADGRYVAFRSCDDAVVLPDTNTFTCDIYVRDRAAGATERASVSSAGTQTGSGEDSIRPSISPDGRYVTFFSASDDLVPGDTNSGGLPPPRGMDLFLHDRQEDTTTRESVSTAGDQGLPDVGAERTAAAANGGFVAFFATSANLVAGDTNEEVDVFARFAAPGGGNHPPLANLAGPYVGFAAGPASPAAVTLDGSDSLDPDGDALSALWSFGDGTPAQATAALTTSHTYSAPGLYTVTLTVSDGSLQSEAVATTVEVLPPVTPDSLVVSPACGGGGSRLEISGVARSANAGLLASGLEARAEGLAVSAVTIQLPWGTTTAQPRLPGLTFETEVTIPAGVASGLHAIALLNGPSEPLTIPCAPRGNRPPVAHAGGPLYSGVVGTPVVFDGTASSDPDGDPLTYHWDFGDGGSAVGALPSHTFDRPGTFLVALVVDDGQRESVTTVGTTSFALVTIGAAGPPPFPFEGFFSPVDNPPTLNLVTAGRAIPVKFSLGGDRGLAIFAAGYPRSQQIACDTSVEVDGIEETVTAGSSTLTYDPGAGRYLYVWKTERGWAGTCRQLVLMFTDDSFRRANFKFR